MNRLKKVIRNCILVILLLAIFLKFSNCYLSPLSAHLHSERSAHYGPSEVLHSENYRDGRYYLCKYDKWISLDFVKRSFFFFWTFGSGPSGFEYNRSKLIDYTWGFSNHYYKLYGIINDDRVKKVKVTLDDGRKFTQTKFYDHLFLIQWTSSENGNGIYKNIKAYDRKDNIIFSEKY